MKSIDHIALRVSNIKESIEFYSDNFGAEIISEYEDWAFLRFENVKLALIGSNKHPEHIAFEVEDLHTLEALGAPVLHHRDGTHSSYIKDVNGNFVEYIFYGKNYEK